MARTSGAVWGAPLTPVSLEASVAQFVAVEPRAKGAT
jgi:hypothetical protein